MTLKHISRRGGSEDLSEYKKSLKMLKEAKKAIDIICDLSDEMEEEYSDYDERGYSKKDDDYDYDDDRRSRRYESRRR